MKETLGNRIKRLRIERGWSQDELAQKVGYKSRSSINKIELGKTDLSQTQIYEFANVFQVSPIVILGLEGKVEDKPTDDVYLNSNFFHDKRIQKIQKELGAGAVLVFMETCMEAYKRPYKTFIWNDEIVKKIIAKAMGKGKVSIQRINKMIDLSIEMDLFDKKLFQENKVLFPKTNLIVPYNYNLLQDE